MMNKEDVRESYLRQVARFEAEIEGCTHDDERRDVLVRNLDIERRHHAHDREPCPN